MKKYGGPGKKKKSCMLRKCLMQIQPGCVILPSDVPSTDCKTGLTFQPATVTVSEGKKPGKYNYYSYNAIQHFNNCR